MGVLEPISHQVRGRNAHWTGHHMHDVRQSEDSGAPCRHWENKTPDLDLNPQPLCHVCGHDCTSADLQGRNKSVLLNSLPQIGL